MPDRERCELKGLAHSLGYSLQGAGSSWQEKRLLVCRSCGWRDTEGWHTLETALELVTEAGQTEAKVMFKVPLRW